MDSRPSIFDTEEFEFLRTMVTTTMFFLVLIELLVGIGKLAIKYSEKNDQHQER